MWAGVLSGSRLYNIYMITVKSINDISNITLDQNIVFMIKTIDLDPEKLFILIRNLGLHSENVVLDFSEYDNQQEIIEEWCINYITSDIQVDLQTLDKELCDRILDYLKYYKKTTIDYSGNYSQFFIKYHAMLEEICQFISSSIYYSVSLVTANKIPFEFVDLKDTTSFKQNVMNLFKYVKSFEVELMLEKHEKHDYQIFHNKNFAENFSKLATTSMYALFLYGQSTPQWKIFQKLLSYC